MKAINNNDLRIKFSNSFIYIILLFNVPIYLLFYKIKLIMKSKNTLSSRQKLFHLIDLMPEPGTPVCLLV